MTVYVFDFDHTLCDTPNLANRATESLATPKGVSDRDPPRNAILQIAYSLSRNGFPCYVATYRKAHTFKDVTEQWINNFAPKIFREVLLNPCSLPEKEGAPATQVKLNHCIKIQMDLPDENIVFFDDDPLVVHYLRLHDIEAILV